MCWTEFKKLFALPASSPHILFCWVAAVPLYCGSYYAIAKTVPVLAPSLAVSIAFFFCPLSVLLFARKATGLEKPLQNIGSGLAVYFGLLLWVLLYYAKNPDFFLQFKYAPSVLPLVCMLLALHTMPVDFFTKRVVQAECERILGTRAGIGIQTLVWTCGHYREFFWLQALMGLAGAFAFLLVSGALTGIVYAYHKNVLALMLGHWLLNVWVLAFVSLCSA